MSNDDLKGLPASQPWRLVACRTREAREAPATPQAVRKMFNEREQLIHLSNGRAEP